MIAKTNDSPPFTIPIIDISDYLHNPTNPNTKAQTASQIRTASTTSGFFQITGHSIPSSLQEKYLNSVKHLFSSLTPSEKSRISFANSNCNRGYESLGGQKLDQLNPATASPDQKEGFSIRGIVDQPPGRFLAGANLWPDENLVLGFRRTTEEYFRAVHELSKTLFRLIALSLDLPEKYFDELVADQADRKLRCHHYPPTPFDPEGRTRGVGAHTDFGALTLLLQDEVGGLEVLDRKAANGEGRWHLVPPMKGAYVVNLGDLMQRWTNDRYMSTMHRVIAPLEGKDRYSAAFFNDGPLDYVIECIPTCLAEGEKPKYQPIRLEDHLLGRYRGSYDTAGEKVVGGNDKE